jgi:hypothetical protein
MALINWANSEIIVCTRTVVQVALVLSCGLLVNIKQRSTNKPYGNDVGFKITLNMSTAETMHAVVNFASCLAYIARVLNDNIA